MKPKIIFKDTMYLLGMDFYGDPFSNHSDWNQENEIGLLWKRLKSFLEDYPEMIKNRIK